MTINRMKYLIVFASIALFTCLAEAQTEWAPYSGNPTLLPSVDPNAKSIYAPAVTMHKGKYQLIYSRKFTTKAENIGHAVSDDGLVWTNLDTLALGLSTDLTRFDSKQLGQPSLISEGDTLKMWYWGSGPHGGNIGLAWSLDGKAWTRVDGPATDKSVYDLTMDGTGSPAIACPNVIKDGSGYKLWYSRVRVTGTVISYVIGHASSPDGLVWTKVAGSGSGGAVIETGPVDKFDAAMSFFSSVVKDGSTYRMWYTGADSTGTLTIGYATSADGIAWTKFAGAAGKDAVLAGATGSVMKSGDGFKIWYMGKTGLDYATSGLPVGIGPVPARTTVNALSSPSRFDAQGKRIERALRKGYPGIAFPKP